MHSSGGYESLPPDQDEVMTGNEASSHPALERFVGRSRPVRTVLNDLVGVAATHSPVLLEGDSGTGKELTARIIHELACPEAPFEAINCGAIPETLLESELFGHVTGAFTGANRTHHGVFERAASGTVFLDEIAELSPAAQVKLLRVLQEKTFTPVGGERSQATAARVVAATNRDLKREVKQGRFRMDLYYRLSVFPIRLPTLAQRREDIPLLVDHFLDLHSQELGTGRPRFHPVALKRLMVYSFPGNVRELQNIVSALLIETRGARVITDRHVRSVFSRHRLDEDMGLDESGDEVVTTPVEVGRWVMDQLRLYHFNIALAERMLTARKRESADPRQIPVCSRSGLTYYLQGEGFRALAAERWSLPAACNRIAGSNGHRQRVGGKLERFMETARHAMTRGRTPATRLAALRKAFAKMPLEYQEDLVGMAEAFERGRWS